MLYMGDDDGEAALTAYPLKGAFLLRPIVAPYRASALREHLVRLFSVVCAILSLFAMGAYAKSRSPSLRDFGVIDEIGIAHFGDPYTGQAAEIAFSPDRRYFAVNTERGRLEVNRPEGSLRIYRSADVLKFLKSEESASPAEPVWIVIRSTDVQGPIIKHWRWLADSSGIAFLESAPQDTNRLVLADLRSKTIETLSPLGRAVDAFDIRDARNYVYVLASNEYLVRAQAEELAAAIAAAGRPLAELLFPVDLNSSMAGSFDRGELWAVVDGQRMQLKDPDTRQPFVLFDEGQRSLALSPDGRSLITAVALSEIPVLWESQYPPPFAESPYRVRAGRQDLTTSRGYRLLSQYMRIDLTTGRAESLTNAPTSGEVGWWSGGSPQWSTDGQAVLLPATFYHDPFGAPIRRPCGALYINLSSGYQYCVEPLKAALKSGYETGFHTITDIRFEDGDRTRPVVQFYDVGGTLAATQYHENARGTWTSKVSRDRDGNSGTQPQLQIAVRQDLNDPPVLVATDRNTKVSRILWDPNPQLKEVALGRASVYVWKDARGTEWRGGLYVPTDFTPGRRYPLVIQTHGFAEHQFRPSGIFPTAMAARALAAAGVLVLQVGQAECAATASDVEVSCEVEGYKAAVEHLKAEGIIDPERVGIVGFSRTCFYVMQALTASALRIKAASITDGVMGDYLQYLTEVDTSGNSIANEFDSMVGARPFGDGLQTWLKRSPLFNADKVTAPLLVVAEGRAGLLFMWGPYAALRYLHKPVDLIILNTDEHVLTNPAVRLASQGGSVDWFRFWLQDYEDPDPKKAAQYGRWRALPARNDAK
jgi:dipeptidyl aminopeptidase/acylaminoacyl peptidase